MPQDDIVTRQLLLEDLFPEELYVKPWTIYSRLSDVLTCLDLSSRALTAPGSRCAYCGTPAATIGGTGSSSRAVPLISTA